MQMHDGLYNGQSQPGSLSTPHACGICAVKTVKYPVKIRIGDARSGIANNQLDLLAGLFTINPDAATGWRMTQGITQQITDSAAQEIRVCSDGSLSIIVQGNILFIRHCLIKTAKRGHFLMNVQLLLIQRVMFLFCPGQKQKGIYHTRQAFIFIHGGGDTGLVFRDATVPGECQLALTA